MLVVSFHLSLQIFQKKKKKVKSCPKKLKSSLRYNFHYFHSGFFKQNNSNKNKNKIIQKYINFTILFF